MSPEQLISFDADESKYELWDVKFLGYLRIQHLHQIVLSPTDQSDDTKIIQLDKWYMHNTESGLEVEIRKFLWDYKIQRITLSRPDKQI